MQTFPPNQLNFIARIFFFVLTLLLVYILATIGLKEPDMKDVIFRISQLHFKFKVLYLMYFLIAVFIYLAVMIAASLLCVYRIEVDKENGTLIFTGLLKKRAIQSTQ